MIVFDQLGRLGRLGNQLFQIAATVSHAKNMNTAAMFNTWDYNKYLLNPINDSFTDENGCYINDQEHDMLCFPNQGYYPLPKVNNLIISGFLQSEKYFENNRELILRTFSPKNDFLQVVRLAGKSFLSQKNLTAIHIRRGDFLDNQDFYPVQSLFYYYEAINMLLEKLNNDKINIVVFSDDILWCRENFRYPVDQHDRINFVQGNSDIVDLYLMAHCNHHIIANSSFSWWGSWLKVLFTDNKGYTFAPSNWFGISKVENRKDIYCKGWEIV